MSVSTTQIEDNGSKIKKYTLYILCFIILIGVIAGLYGDEVGPNTMYSCRYYSDHTENSNSMATIDPTMPADQKGGIVGLFQLGSDLYDIANNIYYAIDNDIIFISVSENDKDEKLLAKSFESKLKNKEIIPVYYYSGLMSNFYEKYDYSDVETPFGKRDKLAKGLEFVFHKKSVKSRLVYFGLWFMKDGKPTSQILWSVDQNTSSVKIATNEDYIKVSKFKEN